MRAVTFAAACAAASFALTPVPALASCGPTPPLDRAIEEAETVFVGTVTQLANGGRWATVEVEEIWKGEVAAEAEVRAGPADPPGPASVITSVDRTYELGVRYLFVPWRARSDEVFFDNRCSATQRYSEGLGRYRPAGAGPPEAAQPRSDPPHAIDPGALDGAAPWSLPAAAALGFCAAVLIAVGLGARPR